MAAFTPKDGHDREAFNKHMSKVRTAPGGILRGDPRPTVIGSWFVPKVPEGKRDEPRTGFAYGTVPLAWPGEVTALSCSSCYPFYMLAC